MKKILIAVFLFVGGLMFLVPQTNLLAEEGGQEFIELYPYNNKDSMDPNSGWTGTMVGTSNWTFTFDKWRYHASRGQVRYVKDWEDADNDGLITATEMTHKTWASFGTVNINDTVEDVVLSTVNGRTDISSNVVDRIWARFDEEGTLYMFEDQIFADYLVVNEGDQTATGQDWRLGTDAEIAAFNASEDAATEFPNMLKSHIRVLLDETEEKGYVLEPIRYITWNHLWFGQDGFDDQPKTIIPAVAQLDSPDDVLIKAGDTVVSFGSLDRDGSNPQTVAFIKQLPYIMTGLRDGVNKVEVQYEAQPPTFGTSLVSLDKDLGTPGINFIIDYNAEFETSMLTNGVEATYVKMFDDAGVIINEVTKLDYEIIFEKDGEIAQTVKVLWDAEEEKYIPESEITVIDTSEFGGYLATYRAVSPVDAKVIGESTIDVAVGLIPPRFEDVPPIVYMDENQPITDLPEFFGVTADNGYGTDLTNKIEYILPEGFNQYNPTPGTYTVGLKLVYDTEVPEGPGVPEMIEIDGVGYEVTLMNSTGTIGSGIKVFNEPGIVYGNTGYATVVIAEFDETGKMVKSVDRTSWKTMGEGGQLADSTDATIKTWLEEEVDFEGGHYVVYFGSQHLTVARALEFGDEALFVDAIPPVMLQHQFVITSSFSLVVDDKTAPTLSVRNTNYKVTAGEFTNVNQTILANVLATDNFTDNPLVIVTSNGGLNLSEVGTYTVKVLASDDAGNDSQELTFTVEVVADKAAELEDQLTDANDKITDLENQITDLEGQIDDFQEALDAKKEGTSIVVTIVVAVVAAGLAFGGAFLLGRKTP